MDTAKTEVLAFAVFPREHWRKIWSTNPLERLNKEIKRRARVVGIFPNEAAVIRLVGVVLADTNDEWITDERRYLSEGSMALLTPTSDNETVALTDGDRSAPRSPQSPPPQGTLTGHLGLEATDPAAFQVRVPASTSPSRPTRSP